MEKSRKPQNPLDELQIAMLASGPILCIAAAPDTTGPASLAATAAVILHVAGMLAIGFGSNTRTTLSMSCATGTLAAGAAAGALSMTAPAALACCAGALTIGMGISRASDKAYRMMASEQDGACNRG